MNVSKVDPINYKTLTKAFNLGREVESKIINLLGTLKNMTEWKANQLFYFFNKSKISNLSSF